MRLVELSVTNFRSLGDVQGIPIHKQTILTGHNDCGKTATLDAIAFLLGERPLADSDISQFAESEPARAALPSDDDAAEPIAVTVEGRFDLSITDGHGTPLAVLLTGGNRNDVTQLLPLLDAIPPVPGRVGRPRRKPDSLFADRGYDHDIHRDQVHARGIVPAIARRGTLHGTGLGTYRWVVERSFA